MDAAAKNSNHAVADFAASTKESPQLGFGAGAGHARLASLTWIR
jgi:hypothetical protein